MEPAILAGLLRLFGLAFLANALFLTLDRYRTDLVKKMVLAGGAMLIAGSAAEVIAFVATLAVRLDQAFLPLLAEYLHTTRVGRLMLVEIGAALAAVASLLLISRARAETPRRILLMQATTFLLSIPLIMAAKGTRAPRRYPC